MGGGLRRREFLKLLGVAAAGSLVHCGGSETTPFRQKNVIVVGAGLAGLTCAYELQKAGHQVQVLEAQARVGGRVLTVREPFTNGLWAEMGAMRIPNTHAFTLAYANQFGIPIMEFEASTGTSVRPLFYVGGQRFAIPDAGKPWPLDFTADEQQAGLGMIDSYFTPFALEAGDPRLPGWPSPEAVARFDGITLAEHLASLGASDDWRDVFVALHGSYTSAVSMLQVFSHEFGPINAFNRYFTMRGGNDQLPRAFAQALDGKIKLESPVLQVEHGPDSVAVTYQEGAAARTDTAEFLVLAIPFPALRNVALVPEFPEDKMRAINEIDYLPGSRLAFQTSRRFWREEVPRGYWVACTDTLAERLWDQSDGQDTDAGLLVSYAQTRAATLTAMPPEARLDAVRAEIAQVFPQFSDEDSGIAAAVYWHEDPWAGGILPAYQPGQMGWAYPLMGRREGRVFFAGEHASAFAGWMNGALVSGLRTAMTIHEEP